MAESASCGAGLAAQSEVPAVLAELAGAMADTLELHMKALDPEDRKARQEHRTYAALVGPFREVAGMLQVAAAHMAGATDLPEAPHDMAAMTDPAVLAAFERYVKSKQALVDIFQRMADDDQRMLVTMLAASEDGRSSAASADRAGPTG